MSQKKLGVLVCIHRRDTPGRASCGARGGRAFADALELALTASGLQHVELERIKCFGCCDEGPNARIIPGGTFFHEASAQTVDDVVAALKALEADGSAA